MPPSSQLRWSSWNGKKILDTIEGKKIDLSHVEEEHEDECDHDHEHHHDHDEDHDHAHHHHHEHDETLHLRL